jgi:phosphoenolpyruvate carboxylase
MYRQNIQFPAKDAALREDVHALGGLVGEILREQGGDALLDLVEGDRVTAIKRREGAVEGAHELIERTRGRQPAEARDLVRAFSTWFQVVNLAEKVHRIRRRRQYLNDSKQLQPGGIGDALQRLRKDGVGYEQALELLRGLTLYPVLASHSTESTRRTILRKQQRIADLMLDRMNPVLAPNERRTTWERIRTELTTGWQTEEHPRERLTLADEREHVVFYLAEVIYGIVPAFYEELATALEFVYGQSVEPSRLPGILRFGSWVGGDMDGHPDVHAKTIRETLHRQQQVILNNYFIELQKLAEQLSQSASRVSITKALQSRIDEYVILLPAAQSSTPARHDRMPYRQFLSQLAERVRLTYDGRPNHYENAAQLLADVRLVAESLAQQRGQRAGLFFVDRLIRRINTFGFHLATIDLRQHTDVHRDVIAQGFGDDGWVARSSAERTARLAAALERDEGPTGSFDAVGRRTLAVFETLMHCRHKYGREAIGDYVVSGTTGADDVLSVLLLARWADMIDKRSDTVPLDLAPLFESVGSLEASGNIVRELLAIPAYQQHVRSRDGAQVVQIGYSDTNKESGFAAARWALHQSQAHLVAAMREQGVRLSIFHGRAGTTSRGGGRTEALVRSAPPGAMTGELRVTEQGEVLNNNYGLRSIAMRTLEQSFNAVSLSTAGAGRQPAEDPAYWNVMTTLANRSREVYAGLVHAQSAFYQYFRQATPIDVIERMQIGARPATREGREGLEGLRAAPWAFAWSQSRHFLPGWFGVGSGLESAIATHGATLLSDMLARWYFFSSFVEDIEIMLAMADMEIAGFYNELAEPALQPHFDLVRAEHERARELMLKLKGEYRLLDGDPTLQRSVKLRNPYIDPMHLMQIDLLRRWRSGGREDRDLFDALVASVTGIAQGLQATG